MPPHPDGQQLQVYALDFPDGKGLFREETLIPIEGSHPGKAFRTGKALVKGGELEGEQSLEHHQRVAGEGCIRAVLPLIVVDAPQASGPGSTAENAFDADEVEFLIKSPVRWPSPWKNALAYGE
jgi:hypothetical protein